MLGNLALIALCALFLLASLACTRTFTVVTTATPPPEPTGDRLEDGDAEAGASFCLCSEARQYAATRG